MINDSNLLPLGYLATPHCEIRNKLTQPNPMNVHYFQLYKYELNIIVLFEFSPVGQQIEFIIGRSFVQLSLGPSCHSVELLISFGKYMARVATDDYWSA